jgi:hypothetical protein
MCTVQSWVAYDIREFQIVNYENYDARADDKKFQINLIFTASQCPDP